MKPVAVRTITRTDMALVDGFAALGSATVHEAQGRIGNLRPYMRPIYDGDTIAGNALTVLAQPGDNWMIHVALEFCQAGDILVVACVTENTDGFFGDLLATCAQSRGVRGIVIDGGVRDTATLKKMQFPAWSRAVSMKGTVKSTLGAVNVPIVCAGQLVFPGDVIVADDDGVTVVAQKNAAQVLAASEARESDEEAKRTRLENGELTLDVFNLRPSLEASDLEYVDSLEALATYNGIPCKR